MHLRRGAASLLLDDGCVSIGASIGVALSYGGDRRRAPNDLVAAADAMLYEAKAQGRGRTWVTASG